MTSDALDIRPIPSTPLYSPDTWQTLSEEAVSTYSVARAR